jgi:4-hydroxy-tetrahydrodipicolinate synthase
MENKISGVFSVLPTPFAADGSIDFQSLKRVIDLYIRSGINGMTASGVTSETARLSDSERMAVLQIIMEHTNKRVPVIIGASTEGLQTCIDLSRRAKELGAAAVMISPPRLNKLNSNAVVNHFKSVADAVDIPIVIQDYPPVSGFTMEPSLLVRIAREVTSARTIKLEDAPTPFKTAKVLEQADGLSLSILGGLGGMYLLEELMAGAAGAMTGFAVPEILVRIVSLYHSGHQTEAARLFYNTVALMRFEFQEGIGMAIRKEILRRRGAIKHAATRAPGPVLDSSTIRTLDTLLEWFSGNHPEIQWTLD